MREAAMWGGRRGNVANSYIEAEAREERQRRQMKGTLWARRSGERERMGMDGGGEGWCVLFKEPPHPPAPSLLLLTSALLSGSSLAKSSTLNDERPRRPPPLRHWIHWISYQKRKTCCEVQRSVDPLTFPLKTMLYLCLALVSP